MSDLAGGTARGALPSGCSEVRPWCRLDRMIEQRSSTDASRTRGVLRRQEARADTAAPNGQRPTRRSSWTSTTDGSAYGPALDVARDPALLAGCRNRRSRCFVWERHLGAVWCYHTIADPDCHPAPLPDEADRLIASGPEVYFSWRPDPALDPAGTLIGD